MTAADIMSPDDPRHGEYRGYLAHRRDGSEPCEPCHLARLRTHKRARMRLNKGISNRIPLGQRAWDILTNSGCTAVATRTGLGRNNLYRLQRRGPNTQVIRSTRDKILAAAPGPTPIGIQRRLQALARLGWTMPEISAITGSHVSNLRVLARRTERPQMVKSHFAEAIITAYDQLHMQLPQPGRFTTRQVNRAIAKGWLPPLAWNDIDDPNERPQKGRSRPHSTDVDPVVIERVLAGDRLPTTTAEKREITARWEASGRSLADLERLTGWKSDRYVERKAS